jgi:hypothetical protein
MESWRNRKTLIFSRADLMGLLTPAEYVGCVEQAYRMHGEGRYYMDLKHHIVLDKYPGEWEAMPSYIEEPEAAACKWVSIRERLPARHLRWQLSYGDAHRRRRRLSEMDGAARLSLVASRDGCRAGSRSSTLPE